MKRILFACMLAVFSLSTAFAANQTPSGKGFRIWFDAGGSPGESYTETVVKGAQQAAIDLGVELKLVYSDWQPEKMLQNFKNGLANRPSGLVVMGHPGDDAYAPLIHEAFAEGMAVTAIDTDLPVIREKYKSRGFGFVGPDDWARGADMAREILRRNSFGAGSRAMVWGFSSMENRGRSTRAMIEELRKAGMEVDDVEISDEINKDISLGAPVLSGYLTSHPDCKLIVVDHGALTGQMENFLKSAGFEADSVYVAGFSLSETALDAVKSGYLDLVGDVQPYLVGYGGVLQIVQTVRFGFSGLNVDTGGGFLSKENLQELVPLVKQGIR